MDKAVIYGVYHFLGFRLCQQLLEQGIQVDGYPIGNQGEHDFWDDKKLQIGRNANFNECDRNEIGSDEEEIGQKNVIFISFYDLEFLANEGESPNQQLCHFIQKSSKTKNVERLICLCPDHFSLKLEEMLRSQFISYINEIQFIYLPTVVDPLQKNEPNLDNRDNTKDKIDLDDAINQIFHIIHSGDKTDLHLKSNKMDQ
jgi:hypothetical protein